MPFPAHYIHVYQRPKAGTSFFQRYLAYNYQHSIVNQGWFDTASCDLAIRSEGEGQTILDTYLGCFVQIYVDNPAQPIWEGLINRITFNSGGASYSISLDELANRVTVVYTGAANAAAETPAINSAGSQGIYGVKQDQVEFGPDPSAGTQRTVLQNTILGQRAFPQTSVSQAAGQTNLVHLELVGIFHTLEWEKFFFTVPTAVVTAFSTRIATYLGALANGTTFFNNADLTQISTNTATTPNQQRAVSFWEIFQKIAESGDGTNYWICGILPTDKNLGTRRFYYRIANSTISYTAFQKDGLKPRNAYGQPIPPWLIVPDVGIRVVDQLVGKGGNVITDPSATYIQSIQYDANSQRVQWFGADDTTARAAFMLKRGFKPIARSFGAPLRTIVT